MGLISGKTIITSLSLFHITLGYFFLTSPGALADQTLVFIIGEAMGMPESRAFERQSAPLAFLAAVLLIIGISDLVALSQPEEITMYHWGSQAPVRLSLFFILTFYSFFLSDASPFYSTKTYSPSTWGEGLKNRLFFTWAFVEMITWFWVFVTLREERREWAVRLAEKRAAEEERL